MDPHFSILSVTDRALLGQFLNRPSAETYKTAQMVVASHRGTFARCKERAVAAGQVANYVDIKIDGCVAGLYSEIVAHTYECVGWLVPIASRLLSSPVLVENLASRLELAGVCAESAGLLGLALQTARVVDQAGPDRRDRSLVPPYHFRLLVWSLLLADVYAREPPPMLGGKHAFLLQLGQRPIWSHKTDRTFLSQRGPESRRSLKRLLADIDRSAYFLDHWAAPQGEHNAVFLWRNIWDCRRFVALLSPGYEESGWCRTEREVAKLIHALDPADRHYVELEPPSGAPIDWTKSEALRNFIQVGTSAAGATSRATASVPGERPEPVDLDPAIRSVGCDLWTRLWTAVYESRQFGFPTLPPDVLAELDRALKPEGGGFPALPSDPADAVALIGATSGADERLVEGEVSTREEHWILRSTNILELGRRIVRLNA